MGLFTGALATISQYFHPYSFREIKCHDVTRHPMKTQMTPNMSDLLVRANNDFIIIKLVSGFMTLNISRLKLIEHITIFYVLIVRGAKWTRVR